MIKIISELHKVKDKILEDKKSLLFFGLFARNDVEDMWDLVITAEWVKDGNTREATKYIINILKKYSLHNHKSIRQIVTFSPNENFVNHLALAFKKEEIALECKTTIKLFSDFQIDAVVLHHEFSEFTPNTTAIVNKKERVAF